MGRCKVLENLVKRPYQPLNVPKKTLLGRKLAQLALVSQKVPQIARKQLTEMSHKLSKSVSIIKIRSPNLRVGAKT